MLRCTVNLVACIPQGGVDVDSEGPGLLTIQGSPGDPALYTQLKVELNETPYNKSNKFVFLLGEKLPPGVEIIKKEYKFPNTKQEFDKHLESIEQGCIIYYHEETTDNDQGAKQLVKWLRGISVPFIYSICLSHSVEIFLFDWDTMFPQ